MDVLALELISEDRSLRLERKLGVPEIVRGRSRCACNDEDALWWSVTFGALGGLPELKGENSQPSRGVNETNGFWKDGDAGVKGLMGLIGLMGRSFGKLG